MHIYDYLIVGSGAGGATLARELAKKGKDVMVLERGQVETQLGTFKDAVRFFDANKITLVPKKSEEGTIIWRTLMAGGSTMVSCANGVRCLQSELRQLGVDLEDEFQEVEAELHIIETPETLLSEGSKTFLQVSQAMGLQFQPMPKFVNAEQCHRCGLCVFGCAYHAHWTALDTLREAIYCGTHVEYGAEVKRVLVKQGRAFGVEVASPRGIEEYYADAVILSAGGLGTPVILLNSGIEEAGGNLFIDLQIHSYGVTEDLNQLHEPLMALVDLEFHNEYHFLLSPFINAQRQVRLIEGGLRAFALPVSHSLGLMAKFADEPVGRVFPDGSVSKPVSRLDQQRISKATEISRHVLEKAGVNPGSIVITQPAGSHPGGTAAIGTVVDQHFQTRVDNLFVCDASVLPVSPGLPPIVTILALARKLAKQLN